MAAGNSHCKRVYSLIGLAAKKGAVVSGSEACERAMKKRAAGLLLLAGDSAANTSERFIRLSDDSAIERLVFGVRSELGRRIGKGDRSVMIVTDINLANGIRELLSYVSANNGGV